MPRYSPGDQLGRPEVLDDRRFRRRVLLVPLLPLGHLGDRRTAQRLRRCRCELVICHCDSSWLTHRVHSYRGQFGRDRIQSQTYWCHSKGLGRGPRASRSRTIGSDDPAICPDPSAEPARGARGVRRGRRRCGLPGRRRPSCSQVMKMGFAHFGRLIDLKQLEELHGIASTDGELRIGAATTHREIERSAIAGQAFPALIELERGVANVRVRSTGTISSNLAFAEPHSDPATLLLASKGVPGSSSPGRPAGAAFRSPSSSSGPWPHRASRTRSSSRSGYTGRPAGRGSGVREACLLRAAGRLGRGPPGGGGRRDQHGHGCGRLDHRPADGRCGGGSSAGRGQPAEPEALAAALAQAEAAFDRLDIGADLNGSADYKRHLAGVLLASTAPAALAEAVAHA